MACPTRVQLFATCLIEALRPEAGLAVVDVLERLGLAAECPDGQTCCGQPAFNIEGGLHRRGANMQTKYLAELLAGNDG